MVDAHFAGREHWDYLKRPFEDVKGSEEIIKQIKKDLEGEILFLGPDIGSQKRTGLGGTTKKRHNSYLVEIHSEEELIGLIKQHRKIACIDDFSETGGTMLKFWDFSKKHNPGCVLIAGLTHGTKQAGIDRTKEKYERLYLGNTIDRKEANVDVTPLIMRSLGILK